MTRAQELIMKLEELYSREDYSPVYDFSTEYDLLEELATYQEGKEYLYKQREEQNKALAELGECVRHSLETYPEA